MGANKSAASCILASPTGGHIECPEAGIDYNTVTRNVINCHPLINKWRHTFAVAKLDKTLIRQIHKCTYLSNTFSRLHISLNVFPWQNGFVCMHMSAADEIDLMECFVYYCWCIGNQGYSYSCRWRVHSPRHHRILWVLVCRTDFALTKQMQTYVFEFTAFTQLGCAVFWL